jgi:hypothetical protein
VNEQRKENMIVLTILDELDPVQDVEIIDFETDEVLTRALIAEVIMDPDSFEYSYDDVVNVQDEGMIVKIYI